MKFSTIICLIACVWCLTRSGGSFAEETEPAKLREQAADGNVKAIYKLGSFDDDTVQPFLRQLLETSNIDVDRQFAIRVALVKAGDHEQQEWFLQKLEDTALDDYQQEKELLTAARYIGDNPEVVGSLIEMLSKPDNPDLYPGRDIHLARSNMASDEFKSTKHARFYPPRSLTVMKALADIVEDPEAPDMSEVGDKDWERQLLDGIVDRWLNWWKKKQEAGEKDKQPF